MVVAAAKFNVPDSRFKVEVAKADCRSKSFAPRFNHSGAGAEGTE
jgi:hypothetical protein